MTANPSQGNPPSAPQDEGEDATIREGNAKRSIIRVAAVTTTILIALLAGAVLAAISRSSISSLLTGIFAVAIAAVVASAETKMRRIEDQTWQVASRSHRGS